MENTQSNSSPEKKERRFSQEQYDMLIRCSEKKDITEWNEWREQNPEAEILLEGADFNNVHLEGADFRHAHLKNACFDFAYLENAQFFQTHLENTRFNVAHLENATFYFAHLENAKFDVAHLENAEFHYAHMENAVLTNASIKGAIFSLAYLQSANLQNAIGDGETLFFEFCNIDKNTDFRVVNLDNLRIGSGLKQLIEYNNRRLNWFGWYRSKSDSKLLRVIRRILTFPIRLFWWVSDYGRSTWRIILTFFILAFIFGGVYYFTGMKDPNNCIVDNLFIVKEVGKPPQEVSPSLVPFRAVYFSIVTMTTLGFGDMYAHFNSFWGHLLLMIQVLLGYILLAALVTRFAVLFTAGGPSGKFSKIKKKDKK